MIDEKNHMCYSGKAKKEGFFFMSKKEILSRAVISATRESGGGNCARENHIGMYGL